MLPLSTTGLTNTESEELLELEASLSLSHSASLSALESLLSSNSAGIFLNDEIVNSDEHSNSALLDLTTGMGTIDETESTAILTTTSSNPPPLTLYQISKLRKRPSFFKTLARLSGLSEPVDVTNATNNIESALSSNSSDCSTVDEWESLESTNYSIIFGTRDSYIQFYHDLLDSCFVDITLPNTITDLISHFIGYELTELVLIQDVSRGGLWNVGQIVDLRIFASKSESSLTNNINSPIVKVDCVGWSVVFSEWISIDSPRIRPLTFQTLCDMESLSRSFTAFEFYDLRSVIFYRILQDPRLNHLLTLICLSTENRIFFELPIQLLLHLGKKTDLFCRSVKGYRQKFLMDLDEREKEICSVSDTLDMLRRHDTSELLSETDKHRLLSLLYRMLDVKLLNESRHGRSVLKSDALSVEECWLLCSEKALQICVEKTVCSLSHLCRSVFVKV